MKADGVTDLGKALDLIADALDAKKTDDRGIGPVLVMILGSQPTDDWRNSLDRLDRLPCGRKATRIAIAVGQDADRDVLQAFIANTEMKILDASSIGQLPSVIRWGDSVTVCRESDDNPVDSDTYVSPLDRYVW